MSGAYDRRRRNYRRIRAGRPTNLPKGVNISLYQSTLHGDGKLQTEPQGDITIKAWVE